MIRHVVACRHLIPTVDSSVAQLDRGLDRVDTNSSYLLMFTLRKTNCTGIGLNMSTREGYQIHIVFLDVSGVSPSNCTNVCLWMRMPRSLNSNSTSNVKNAVLQFCQECGKRSFCGSLDFKEIPNSYRFLSKSCHWQRSHTPDICSV